MPIKYFYRLWELLFDSPVTQTDSLAFLKFLKKIAADQWEYSKNFAPEEGKLFFQEKICNSTKSYENLTIEAFACIFQFFILINENDDLLSVTYSISSDTNNAFPEIKVKTFPNNLNGIEIFWKIVREANDKDVAEKSRDILNKLFTQLSDELESVSSQIRASFIETYLDKLKKAIDNKQGETIGKLIKLMKDMIEESERKGTSGLKSHSGLLKGELLSLVIFNNLTDGSDIPKKMNVETYENTTVWELKIELGKYFNSSPCCIKLKIDFQEVKDTENGKALSEFVQKRKGIVMAEKKNMDDIPKVPLLLYPQMELTEQAKNAFTEIFGRFSKNGKMVKEDLESFIRVTTGVPDMRSGDARVDKLLTKYDRDNDKILQIADFLQFYLDSLLSNKEDTVWKNLYRHGYRNDLKKLNELEDVKIDIQTLPRCILSCNPKAFELFFTILDLGNSSVDLAWDLITRLSTNEVIYNDLYNFSSKIPINQIFEWENIIPTHSTFKLFYYLQVIESFLEEENSSGSEETAKNKNKWREDFIEKGGIEFLIGIMLNNDPNKGICFYYKEKLTKIEKECLSLIGKMINRFLRIAMYSLNDNMLQLVEKVKMEYNKNLKRSQAEEILPAEEKKNTSNLISAKKKNEDFDKEQPKETVQNLEELFKKKPSNILFIETPHQKQSVLFQSINKNQAEYIISLVNLKELWSHQLILLDAVLKQENIIYSDTIIVQSSLQLFCSCLLCNEDAYTKIRNYANGNLTFSNLIIHGIFCPQSQSIREEFMETLFTLCNLQKEKPAKDTLLSYILSIFLGNIPKKHSRECRDCGEYFNLVCNFIDMHYLTSLPKESPTIDYKELLKSLVSNLKAHRTSEQRNAFISDKLLIGIIDTIRKLLEYNNQYKEEMAIKEGLLHELFNNCLFPSLSTPSESSQTDSQETAITDSQKCKSKDSRTAAYKLLATLCRGNSGIHIYMVKECLEPLCLFIKPHVGWAYIPSSESRSKLGYAGIENLGCICYMISMIQQFFMIPTFRYALLGALDKNNNTILKKEGEVDDNVLHQMQRLFSFLELTERQDYDPSNFCFAFKDLEGKPTNTSLQQDAHEFLNLIFDRLENLLKPTPDVYLLKSVFGGKNCNQIICKGGCKNVRKNYEDFYYLSLGVKGNNTLYEALNKYIAGDTISGYSCEQCKKKVEAVKRTCLDELPNVLIIHLQRIIYNFDFQMNEKINSRLEFPKEINMEPYTIEGLEAREKVNGESEEIAKFHGKGEMYYQYKLVGVVVHLGTADAGHYFSYINTNRGSK